MQPSNDLIAAGFRQRCPACGRGKLFSGVLAVHDHCPECGNDLKRADTADGPAFFVITLLGTLLTFGAVWVHLAFHPPYLLQLLLWPPVTLLACILALRYFKAAMIAHHYQLKGKGDDDGL